MLSDFVHYSLSSSCSAFVVHYFSFISFAVFLYCSTVVGRGGAAGLLATTDAEYAAAYAQE